VTYKNNYYHLVEDLLVKLEDIDNDIVELYAYKMSIAKEVADNALVNDSTDEKVIYNEMLVKLRDLYISIHTLKQIK
jgi:hypothetical protein